MSDVSGGEGWWQASDGKWYPPQQAADPVPYWPAGERVADPAPVVNAESPRSSRSKRWLGGVAVLAVAGLVTALIVVLSGGDSEAPVATDQDLPFQVGEPSQASVDRAERAIDLLGGFSPAVVGVLSATDRGYSAAQIFEGIDSSGLQGDGTILAAGREPIPPAGAASGLIEYALGEPELVAFTVRAGDLSDEQIDQLTDEELDQRYDTLFEDLDLAILEKRTEELLQAMREDFPDPEGSGVFADLALGRLLQAIADGAPTEELIFLALTGEYSDQELLSQAESECEKETATFQRDCIEKEAPGLLARMAARQRAARAGAQRAADAVGGQADQIEEPADPAPPAENDGGATAPEENQPPDVPMPASPAGLTFSTSFGDLTFTGPSRATYPTQGGTAEIQGTLSGLVLTGEWSDAASGIVCATAGGPASDELWGRFEFTFSEDFSSFAGVWNHCDEAMTLEWNGTALQG